MTKKQLQNLNLKFDIYTKRVSDYENKLAQVLKWHNAMGNPYDKKNPNNRHPETISKRVKELEAEKNRLNKLIEKFPEEYSLYKLSRQS